MANKKKTVEDEKPSTNKKGITKINTTRTQKIVEKTKSVTKRTPAKSATSKVKAEKSTATEKAKKETAKKASTTKATSKTKTTKAAKDTTAKKSTKTTTKKTTKTASTKKATSAKATTTRKPRAKKLVANDKITASTPLVHDFAESEYYDLPFTYNKTVVKILAQTPEILFVYWDISEEDRKKYIEKYGENFFNETKPVLIITNKTMGYTFEVDINDFANSWYLHVNDAKCEYNIELGRRPITRDISIPNNYVYVASSNVIEAPNDHILFEKAQNMVYFKNVKTNVVSSKPITNLSLISNLGRIYNIYDVYKKIYKDETFENSKKIMGNSSSVFK